MQGDTLAISDTEVARLVSILAEPTLADADLAAAGAYLPDVAHLRGLLRTAFWASLEQEEARPVRLRLQLRRPYAGLRGFAEPPALTPEAVRKLSPLLDEARNSLVVDERGDIIGVATGPAPLAEIFAPKPGVLLVRRALQTVARFARGVWTINDRWATWLSTTSITFSDEDEGVRLMKSGRLGNLVQAARRHARGALLVVLPQGTDGLDGLSPPRVTMSKLGFPATASGPDRHADKPFDTARLLELHEQTAFDQEFESVLGLIAAGAGIDGATVLTHDLELLGFGAKIGAMDDNATLDLVDLTTGERGTSPLPELAGMRRQSAARLVQRHHDALAVVVSQDGPVTACLGSSQSERIAMLSGLEYFL